MSMAMCWMLKDLFIISKEQELWLLQFSMMEKNQFLHQQRLRVRRRSNLFFLRIEEGDLLSIRTFVFPWLEKTVVL